ncbi:flagellar biosynthesis regulator FlaF [Sphingomonas sp. CARO-RG-8B-R24-01]|uniref:flagellar biosynthesis regulator FlaF n=1 Tax=Sphingomonas sp. CARO-RG-8B-R24-01 TaxID=2914831 RepID=UPI001F574160|nr:flagellar biosynthesis regulator FlaF [Sphingomonas sp. CARO-RG-8B-R24-01]
MSVEAYCRARTIVESPRATERRLIGQMIGTMIAARDEGLQGVELMPVLHRNREMWTTFAAACGAPGNALPDSLRAGIISIGLWVDRFTSDVIAGRASIDPLIGVNRSILDGLATEPLAA